MPREYAKGEHIAATGPATVRRGYTPQRSADVQRARGVNQYDDPRFGTAIKGGGSRGPSQPVRRAPVSSGGGARRQPSGGEGGGAGVDLDIPGGDIIDAPVGLFGAIARSISGQLPAGGIGMLWNNPAVSFFRRPLVQLGLLTIILPGAIGLGLYAYNQGKKLA